MVFLKYQGLQCQLKRRITLTDSNEKNLNSGYCFCILFYTKQKYCNYLDNYAQSENSSMKISLTHKVCYEFIAIICEDIYLAWYEIIPCVYYFMYVVRYEIIPSIYNYIKFYRYTIKFIERN